MGSICDQGRSTCDQGSSWRQPRRGDTDSSGRLNAATPHALWRVSRAEGRQAAAGPHDQFKCLRYPNPTRLVVDQPHCGILFAILLCQPRQLCAGVSRLIDSSQRHKAVGGRRPAATGSSTCCQMSSAAPQPGHAATWQRQRRHSRCCRSCATQATRKQALAARAARHPPSFRRCLAPAESPSSAI